MENAPVLIKGASMDILDFAGDRQIVHYLFERVTLPCNGQLLVRSLYGYNWYKPRRANQPSYAASNVQAASSKLIRTSAVVSGALVLVAISAPAYRRLHLNPIPSPAGSRSTPCPAL